MSRPRLYLALGSLLAVAALFFYVNRDWFASERIQIYYRSSPRPPPGRRGQPASGAVDPIIFGFNRRLPLKSIEVLAVSDLETNKFPHPLWHLVSDSNSVPTRGFVYGANVPGMRPAIKGASAEALQAGVKYRIFVESGSLKGEHDFVPRPRSP